MSKKKHPKATLSGPSNGWWIYCQGDFATDLPDHLSRKQALKAGKAEYDKFLLEGLRNSARKPPKRLVGFVNVATGEKRPAFPDFLTLPSQVYDELLAVTRWIEAMPNSVELPDGAWDNLNTRIVDLIPIDEAQWPGVFVDSVQVETIKTSQRNITPGTFVVLLQHEDAAKDAEEHHCVLVRGNYSP